MRETRFKKRAVECAICISPISIQGQLNSCLHNFCLDCIKRWAKTANRCPVCKQRFSSIKRRPRRTDYTAMLNSRSRHDEVTLVWPSDPGDLREMLDQAERLVRAELQVLLDRFSCASPRDLRELMRLSFPL
mmetsp:Transcript_6770/g.12099  ORF Transcript_6770/g.12099 Transcript_6770/m.12099 type:complete len:132 (-) Transcript_6770:3681-4076(-)